MTKEAKEAPDCATHDHFGWILTPWELRGKRVTPEQRLGHHLNYALLYLNRYNKAGVESKGGVKEIKKTIHHLQEMLRVCEARDAEQEKCDAVTEYYKDRRKGYAEVKKYLEPFVLLISNKMEADDELAGIEKAVGCAWKDDCFTYLRNRFPPCLSTDQKIGIRNHASAIVFEADLCGEFQHKVFNFANEIGKPVYFWTGSGFSSERPGASCKAKPV